VNLVKEIERAHAEVRRGNPGAREKLERLQAEYRTSGATISRIEGTCEVEDRPSAPFSHQPRSITAMSSTTDIRARRSRSVLARPSPDRSPSR
jgi:hypothetical protein